MKLSFPEYFDWVADYQRQLFLVPSKLTFLIKRVGLFRVRNQSAYLKSFFDIFLFHLTFLHGFSAWSVPFWRRSFFSLLPKFFLNFRSCFWASYVTFAIASGFIGGSLTVFGGSFISIPKPTTAIGVLMITICFHCPVFSHFILLLESVHTFYHKCFCWPLIFPPTLFGKLPTAFHTIPISTPDFLSFPLWNGITLPTGGNRWEADHFIS